MKKMAVELLTAADKYQVLALKVRLLSSIASLFITNGSFKK
jgi:hypothetical protein